MSFKKFKRGDVITNTMRAYPQSEFVVFDGKVYYNQTAIHTGSRNAVPDSFNVNVRNVQDGFISLDEYNIDRPYRVPIDTETQESYLFPWDAPDEGEPDVRIPDTGRIYPWISKDSAGSSWKTINTTDYNNEFMFGDILIGPSTLSASITREYTSSAITNYDLFNPHFVAIKNKMNTYGAMSSYFLVSSSAGDKTGGFVSGSTDGSNNPINFVFVPSIFYGSQINPGSVSLKWYYTGSLAGELKDENQNGELVQVGPKDSVGSGSVAGVVMYNEGIFVLTGAWDLSAGLNTFQVPNKSPYPGSGETSATLSWLRFAAGANDGWNPGPSSTYGNAAFGINFQGVTETQVITMFAKAKRGEINYSNNPTYIEKGQETLFKTSSTLYYESPDRRLKNFVSSSYLDYDAPFQRQVFISQIGIYDKNKNLIGVATLGTPILKEDDQAYTFKLKIDI